MLNFVIRKYPCIFFALEYNFPEMTKFNIVIGVGQWHRYGASGASHGGTGGQGACSNHLSCKLSRSKAYGDLKQPLEFGSGGSGARGGSGRLYCFYYT